MADFDLSLALEAEGGRTAAREVDGVTGAVRNLDKASDDLNRENVKTTKSAAQLRDQLKAQAKAIGDVVRATNPAVGSNRALDAALRRAENAYAQGKISAEAYARAQKIAADANLKVTNSTRAAAAGTAQLGIQVNDVATQLSLGARPTQVFAAQAGQIGYAMAQTNGRMQKFGAFLAGPWGAAVILATTLIGGMISRLSEAEDQADDNSSAQDFQAMSLDELSEAIRENRRAMEDQLKTAREVEEQTLANAQAALTEANEIRLNTIEKLKNAQASLQASEQYIKAIEAGGGGSFANQDARVRDLEARLKIAEKTAADARANVALAQVPILRRQQEARDDPLKAAEESFAAELASARDQFVRDSTAAQKAYQDATLDMEGRADARDALQKAEDDYSAAISAAASERDKETARIREERRKTRTRSGREGRSKEDRDAERLIKELERFGEKSAGTIEGLGSKFLPNQTILQQQTDALQELDDLLKEIEERQPPNLAQLREDAEAARGLIEDGINIPFREYVEEQERSIQLSRLAAAGRHEEAEALRIIWDFQDRVGQLLPDQEAAIRSIVRARHQEREALEEALDLQREYLSDLGEAQALLRSIFDFSGGGLKEFPKRLFETLEKSAGDQLADALFGDIFASLTDQATGADTVQRSADRMAKAVDDTNDALKSLERAAQGAAGAIDPLAPLPGGETDDPFDEEIFRRPGDAFEDVLKKLAEGVFGKETAKVIGKTVASALKGAAFGGAAAEAVFGEKGSGLGGKIGGALGQIAGEAIGKKVGGLLGTIGGPLGSIAGGLLGSVVGGLFGGGKKKQGGAVITGAYDSPRLSGNDSEYRAAGGAMADSIQSGLIQIANTLGGELGRFNVSIGSYKGKFRVNTKGGSEFGGHKDNAARGIIDFGQDQAAAIAYAIGDAIGDGAITGLSPAVNKALKAFGNNFEAGLQEALKVKKLEELIDDGLGLDSFFRQLNSEFEERYRLAKTYGLDMVKLEKINQEEREKAIADAIESRVGALQDFLADVRYGDLFEGSAIDRRSALLGEIAGARSRVDAGEEGAADDLANLSRQLIDLSRSAFGTAGPEYASDREAAIADAERIIALETQRVQEAADRQIAALDYAEENNRLTERTNELLQGLLDRFAGGKYGDSTYMFENGGGGGGIFNDPGLITRMSDLR